MAEKPRTMIVGNWKMNGLSSDGEIMVRSFAESLATGAPVRCEIAVCPPATLLIALAEALADAGVALGAQDCHTEAGGAHTGDLSAAMLADTGCAYVIVGHSERRTDHGEADGLVRAKAEAVRAAGMVPIICIGETADQRDGGRAVEIVTGQLDGSLPEGATSDTAVIAYEPVWAIGTGRTPTTADIAEVHASIRARLGDRGAGRARVLYGGSVKPDNAKDILSLGDVDGALVGGASLNADDFWAICRASP
jgi:triosephosphate isomerase